MSILLIKPSSITNAVNVHWGTPPSIAAVPSTTPSVLSGCCLTPNQLSASGESNCAAR